MANIAPSYGISLFHLRHHIGHALVPARSLDHALSLLYFYFINFGVGHSSLAHDFEEVGNYDDADLDLMFDSERDRWEDFSMPIPISSLLLEVVGFDSSYDELGWSVVSRTAVSGHHAMVLVDYSPILAIRRYWDLMGFYLNPINGRNPYSLVIFISSEELAKCEGSVDVCPMHAVEKLSVVQDHVEMAMTAIEVGNFDGAMDLLKVVRRG